LFGWVGHVAHDARVQRSAICDIRKVGGRVYYPYATSEPFEESLPKLSVRCALGSEYVYTVTAVNLNGTRVEDHDVQALSRLGALNGLCLMQTGISDSALTTLYRLDGFEELNVEGTAVSDVGMKHLARCDQLRYLWLRGTQLSDNSVQFIVQLRHLVRLDLRGTAVTAQGVKRIRRSLADADIYHESQPEALARLPRAMQRPLLERHPVANRAGE